MEAAARLLVGTSFARGCWLWGILFSPESCRKGCCWRRGFSLLPEAGVPDAATAAQPSPSLWPTASPQGSAGGRA
eukprot:5005261-Pleurochrysis_carterae.AAC.1